MPESVNIQVGGNVAGSIVVGDANFVVNTNYGSIVYKQARPQVQLRGFAPQPPRQPGGFVDRKSELEQLSGWMSKNEIVLVHGADGLGKSALLRQAANLPAARGFSNGVVLLDNLETQAEAWGAGDLVQKIFDALFESDPPLKVDALTARTYLSNTHPLILFDEIPLAAALQKSLPDMLPQGSLIMAMDIPLGADYQRLPLGPLPRDEALQLLAGKLGTPLSETQRTSANALCALLQDIPLALTITANLVQYGGLSLEEALNTLIGLPAENLDPVPATLDKVYRLAYARLSPTEKKILAVAAQTPGASMSVEWLTAALGANIDQALGRLKAMGLLFTNSPRLRLPPGFADSARRSSVLDENTVLGRLVEYLLSGISSGPEFAQDEAGNLFGALLWAVRTGRPRDVIALGRALDAHLCLHGLWDRWGRLLDLVLEASRQARDVTAEAWALHQLGTREIGTGSRERALDLLRQALEKRRSLGDQAGMAYTQHNIDFLIGPPLPPRRETPKPQSPAPRGKSSGSRVLKFILGLAGLCMALLLLATILPRLFPGAPSEAATTSAPALPPPLTDTPTSPPAEIITTTPTAEETSTFTPTPSPAPTPYGGSGWIVFQNDASNDPAKKEPWSIHTLGIAGYDLRVVSFDSLSSISEPAWSPDGKQLAFTSHYKSDYADIFVADADGTNWRQVTSEFNGQFLGHKTHPTWSPDGNRIAFLLSNNTGSDIYAVDADGKGSNLVNLTNSPNGSGHFDYPDWSPDGGRIAYHAFVNDNWEIFVMNADGSNQVQLTKADSIRQASVQPSWSPDGTQIAFASNRSGNWGIYVMNSAGGDVRVMTQKYNDLMPDWSPDGQLIAFTSDRSGTQQIFVMDMNSPYVTQLTKMDTATTFVDWRPVP